MTRVLAIDPGIDTGWAEGTITPDGIAKGRHGWTKWRPFASSLLDKALGDWPYDVVVYETWLLTPHGAKVLVGSDMQSSQCVGCIWQSVDRARARGNQVRYVGQPPAIKSTIDRWMGGTHYLPKSDVEHNRDAIRHLYYFGYNPKNKTGLKIPTEDK